MYGSIVSAPVVSAALQVIREKSNAKAAGSTPPAQ